MRVFESDAGPKSYGCRACLAIIRIDAKSSAFSLHTFTTLAGSSFFLAVTFPENTYFSLIAQRHSSNRILAGVNAENS